MGAWVVPHQTCPIGRAPWLYTLVYRTCLSLWSCLYVLILDVTLSFVFLWSWPLIFFTMVVTLDHFWFIPLVVILMYFTLDVTLHLWFSRQFFFVGPWPLCFDVTLHLCVPLVVTLMLFDLDVTLHLWSSRRDPLFFFTLVVTFKHSWLIPLVLTLKSWLFTAVVTLDLFRIIPLVVTLMFRLWTWRIHLWSSRLFFSFAVTPICFDSRRDPSFVYLRLWPKG